MLPQSDVVYTRNVFALCRKVNNNMNEMDKTGHILKRITDDTFNTLICKDYDSLEATVNECHNYKQVKSRRIMR